MNKDLFQQIVTNILNAQNAMDIVCSNGNFITAPQGPLTLNNKSYYIKSHIHTFSNVPDYFIYEEHYEEVVKSTDEPDKQYSDFVRKTHIPFSEVKFIVEVSPNDKRYYPDKFYHIRRK